jgi:hypothetical protein
MTSWKRVGVRLVCAGTLLGCHAVQTSNRSGSDGGPIAVPDGKGGDGGATTLDAGLGPDAEPTLSDGGGTSGDGGAGATVDGGSANPVDGACGPADHVAATTPPTTGLCSAGAATAVTGASPFAWSCLGSGGGTNAVCSAPFSEGAKVYFPYPMTTVVFTGCSYDWTCVNPQNCRYYTYQGLDFDPTAKQLASSLNQAIDQYRASPMPALASHIVSLREQLAPIDPNTSINRLINHPEGALETALAAYYLATDPLYVPFISFGLGYAFDYPKMKIELWLSLATLKSDPVLQAQAISLLNQITSIAQPLVPLASGNYVQLQAPEQQIAALQQQLLALVGLQPTMQLQVGDSSNRVDAVIYIDASGQNIANVGSAPCLTVDATTQTIIDPYLRDGCFGWTVP